MASFCDIGGGMEWKGFGIGAEIAIYWFTVSGKVHVGLLSFVRSHEYVRAEKTSLRQDSMRKIL